MKNANVVSSVASNKPDGLSIALIIMLVIIIIVCILWYIFYKPKKEVDSQSVESFSSDEINNLKFFQNNNIGKEIPTDPVHVPVDVLEGSLMTHDQINTYFGSAKKKTQ